MFWKKLSTSNQFLKKLKPTASCQQLVGNLTATRAIKKWRNIVLNLALRRWNLTAAIWDRM